MQQDNNNNNNPASSLFGIDKEQEDRANSNSNASSLLSSFNRPSSSHQQSPRTTSASPRPLPSKKASAASLMATLLGTGPGRATPEDHRVRASSPSSGNSSGIQSPPLTAPIAPAPPGRANSSLSSLLSLLKDQHQPAPAESPSLGVLSPPPPPTKQEKLTPVPPATSHIGRVIDTSRPKVVLPSDVAPTAFLESECDPISNTALRERQQEFRDIIASTEEYVCYPLSKPGTIRLIRQDDVATISLKEHEPSKVIDLSFCQQRSLSTSALLASTTESGEVIVWAISQPFGRPYSNNSQDAPSDEELEDDGDQDSKVPKPEGKVVLRIKNDTHEHVTFTGFIGSDYLCIAVGNKVLIYTIDVSAFNPVNLSQYLQQCYAVIEEDNSKQVESVSISHSRHFAVLDIANSVSVYTLVAPTSSTATRCRLDYTVDFSSLLKAQDLWLYTTEVNGNPCDGIILGLQGNREFALWNSETQRVEQLISLPPTDYNGPLCNIGKLDGAINVFVVYDIGRNSFFLFHLGGKFANVSEYEEIGFFPNQSVLSFETLNPADSERHSYELYVCCSTGYRIIAVPLHKAIWNSKETDIPIPKKVESVDDGMIQSTKFPAVTSSGLIQSPGKITLSRPLSTFGIEAPEVKKQQQEKPAKAQPQDATLENLEKTMRAVSVDATDRARREREYLVKTIRDTQSNSFQKWSTQIDGIVDKAVRQQISTKLQPLLKEQNQRIDKLSGELSRTISAQVYSKLANHQDEEIGALAKLVQTHGEAQNMAFKHMHDSFERIKEEGQQREERLIQQLSEIQAQVSKLQQQQQTQAKPEQVATFISSPTASSNSQLSGATPIPESASAKELQDLLEAKDYTGAIFKYVNGSQGHDEEELFQILKKYPFDKFAGDLRQLLLLSVITVVAEHLQTSSIDIDARLKWINIGLKNLDVKDTIILQHGPEILDSLFKTLTSINGSQRSEALDVARTVKALKLVMRNNSQK